MTTLLNPVSMCDSTSQKDYQCFPSMAALSWLLGHHTEGSGLLLLGLLCVLLPASPHSSQWSAHLVP